MKRLAIIQTNRDPVLFLESKDLTINTSRGVFKRQGEKYIHEAIPDWSFPITEIILTIQADHIDSEWEDDDGYWIIFNSGWKWTGDQLGVIHAIREDTKEKAHQQNVVPCNCWDCRSNLGKGWIQIMNTQQFKSLIQELETEEQLLTNVERSYELLNSGGSGFLSVRHMRLPDVGISLSPDQIKSCLNMVKAQILERIGRIKEEIKTGAITL